MLTTGRDFGLDQTLADLEATLADESAGLTKKEMLQLVRRRNKLDLALGGIRDMGGVPDVLVVIDTNKEDIAILEARKLGIPVVAIIDSNCDPDLITHPVPGNDDAIRAINLYCDLFARAVIDGLQVELAASGADIGAAEEGLAEDLPPVEAAAAEESTGRWRMRLRKHRRGTCRSTRRGTCRRRRNAESSDAPGAPDASETPKRQMRLGGPRHPQRRRAVRQSRLRARDRRHTWEVAKGWFRSRRAVQAAARGRPAPAMMDLQEGADRRRGELEAAAVDWLRKSGLAQAQRKGRPHRSGEGVIGLATAPGQGGDGSRSTPRPTSSRATATSRLWVREVATLALDCGGDIECLSAASYPGNGPHGGRGDHQSPSPPIGEKHSAAADGGFRHAGGRRGRLPPHAGDAGLSRLGVLVAVESDAPAESLARPAHELAMHIAAASPHAVSRDSLDQAMVERERAVLAEQARAEGKPEKIIEKMIEGRLRKFFEEVVLLEQTWVLDGETRVKAMLESFASELGTPVSVSGFVRYQLGEGIERESKDFAAEVAEQLGS